jgi:hypothetical protein
VGYSGGSNFFNTVAQGVAVVVGTEDPWLTEKLINVMVMVVDYLHGDGWDACGEVVDQWRDSELIMQALTRAGCAGGHGRDND